MKHPTILLSLVENTNYILEISVIVKALFKLHCWSAEIFLKNGSSFVCIEDSLISIALFLSLGLLSLTWTNRFEVNNMYFHNKDELGGYKQQPSNWIMSKLTFMVKNEVGENNDLNLTTCFQRAKSSSCRPDASFNDCKRPICQFIELFIIQHSRWINCEL